jgi:hypothetical protein
MFACSHNEKPPYIGVFLKNPGDDFVKLNQGGSGNFAPSSNDSVSLTDYYTRLRSDYARLFERFAPFPDNYDPFPNDYTRYPVAKKGARIYFYGVQIDYTNFFLVLPAYPKGFEKTQVPVKKLAEDLYCVELNNDWLGDGTIALASEQQEGTSRWFLRGEGPRLVTKKVEDDSGREQYTLIAKEDTTSKTPTERWRYAKCGKYTRWFSNGQAACSGRYELPHETLAQAIVDLNLDTLFTTRPDDSTKSRIGNLIQDYFLWLQDFRRETGDFDLKAVYTSLQQLTKSRQKEYEERLTSLLSKSVDLGLTGNQALTLLVEVNRRMFLSVEHGRWTWYQNGRKQVQGDFVYGKRNGTWKWWDSTGNVTTAKVYDNGHIVQTK